MIHKDVLQYTYYIPYYILYYFQHTEQVKPCMFQTIWITIVFLVITISTKASSIMTITRDDSSVNAIEEGMSSVTNVSASSMATTTSTNDNDSTIPTTESLEENGETTCQYKGWSDACNNEPRMFDQETEEKGCKEIVQAMTKAELEAMPDENMPLRHLRADKGDVTKAIKRIKHAIHWRQDFGVNDMLRAATNPTTDEEKEIQSILKHESSPGKMYVRNHDNSKRAILYMFPVKENTNHQKHNIMHLVYALERAIACTEKNGLEKMTIVMDFKHWKMKHSGPMATTKATIHILQECYVERMARVYITNAPLVFRTFWSLVKPFIDPVSKSKIVFCSSKAGQQELRSNFDESKVEECALGTSDLRVFDVDEYFGTPFDETFDELP